MIDPRTQAVLQEIVQRESRSLLQYVGDSFPWATREESSALAQLQRTIEEDRQAVADLIRFAQRQRLPLPYLGSYPSGFTTWNYVALDHLLPRLARTQRQAVTILEQNTTEISDPGARILVEKLLDLKRRHLQVIEGLTASHPSNAA